MKIGSYSFGRIVIEGMEYTGDVIVFHDRVKPHWWRKEGHSLHREDIEEIISLHPSTLIIGRGAMGVLRIPEEIRSLLKDLKIQLVDLRTAAACKEYNTHGDDPRVVGAFHLTC
ncbi:MAG: MTH938/NDUFAF3 family protein [Candidatus Aureabacteria bacterium]|nr:MTH938/NDUFAF3 family protein [Candidatus Auribacterota bacterium]